MNCRAIIIHNLEHARAAMAVAEKLGVALTLRSAPNAAAYLGAAVFRRIIDEAARTCPDVAFTAVLDCGKAPGQALYALRCGIKGISVDAPAEVLKKIADIAARTGAFIDNGEEEALDLLLEDDAVMACREWLKNGQRK
ncbi:MAG: hypothetical protein A3G18_13215 [Rhodospirillales bacterium RIFCSPLOWO2_12_FULL_58_28]|nr:MAG: hypothetical protein A3H92_13070 [Rhodospirillales bacterium RIFCSPLOWO2_02_FULL_58_16]OHC78538.1 MAG: hypothetical protein A3G18_13215 [Rhodospirillales bacterium RIFCSPLOWO2_12_FULL_58_28]